MRFDKFVESLYGAGWKAPCDAQHTNVRTLWRSLFPSVAEVEDLLQEASDECSQLLTRVRELEAENARLRATVAILRVDCFARLDAATKDTGTEGGK